MHKIFTGANGLKIKNQKKIFSMSIVVGMFFRKWNKLQWTAFTDLNLYWIKGALALFVLVSATCARLSCILRFRVHIKLFYRIVWFGLEAFNTQYNILQYIGLQWTLITCSQHFVTSDLLSHCYLSVFSLAVARFQRLALTVKFSYYIGFGCVFLFAIIVVDIQMHAAVIMCAK